MFTSRLRPSLVFSISSDSAPQYVWMDGKDYWYTAFAPSLLSCVDYRLTTEKPELVDKEDPGLTSLLDDLLQ